MRGVIGFAVVIGTILIIAKLLRRTRSARTATCRAAGDATAASSRSISTTPLGPNRQLHLVRIGDEVILVGSGEGGITPLRKFDEDEAIALGVIDPADAQLEVGFADALAGAGVPVAPRTAQTTTSLLDRVRA